MIVTKESQDAVDRYNDLRRKHPVKGPVPRSLWNAAVLAGRATSMSEQVSKLTRMMYEGSMMYTRRQLTRLIRLKQSKIDRGYL